MSRRAGLWVCIGLNAGSLACQQSTTSGQVKRNGDEPVATVQQPATPAKTADPPALAAQEQALQIEGRNARLGGALCRPPSGAAAGWYFPAQAKSEGLKTDNGPPGQARATVIWPNRGVGCLRVDFKTGPRIKYPHLEPGPLELTISLGQAFEASRRQIDVRFSDVEFDAVYSVHVPIQSAARSPSSGEPHRRFLFSAQLRPYGGAALLPAVPQ